MAKSYTATLTVKCWKEHTCVACGAVHSYEFARKVSGRGGTKDKAQKNLKKNIDKTLANEVDLLPCPACGIYQPDMIAQQRVRWYWKTFWIVLIIFATLAILRGTDLLTANTATWVIVVTGVLTALHLFGKELKNFNANPEANRTLATDRITKGTMKLTSGDPATAPPEWVNIPRSLVQTIKVPLLIVGVILLASPELVRVSRGWALNAVAYPPVAGPGDTTRVYMSHKIESLNGYWRGTPHVSLSGPATGGRHISVDATTNQNDWGQEINVDSDAEHNSSTPWVEMHLPNDPSLAGKTVDCQMSLDLEFPQKSGEGSFETNTDNMTQQISLHLASAGAGGVYDQLWWGGGITGMVLILGTNLGLLASARSLRKKANPTKILTAGTPG